MNNWTLTQSIAGWHHLHYFDPDTGHHERMLLTDQSLYALADFLLPYVQRPVLASELDHEPRRNGANVSDALLPDPCEP